MDDSTHIELGFKVGQTVESRTINKRAEYKSEIFKIYKYFDFSGFARKFKFMKLRIFKIYSRLFESSRQ